MTTDTEADRQVRRLQSRLAQVEQERDDALDKIATAGQKARDLRADMKVYRDQAETLAEALESLRARAFDPEGWDPHDLLEDLADKAGWALHTAMVDTISEHVTKDVADAKDNAQ